MQNNQSTIFIAHYGNQNSDFAMQNNDFKFVRIQNAKQFLLIYFFEILICAVCIYYFVENILNKTTKRLFDIKRGGQNKILNNYQTKIIHAFIWKMITHCIQPIHNVIFNAIRILKSV